MKWELIPPDSRERVVPFLSVQDNLLGLNVALTTTKDELRDHLKQFSKYSFKAISNIFKLLDVNRDGACRMRMRARPVCPPHPPEA